MGTGVVMGSNEPMSDSTIFDETQTDQLLQQVMQGDEEARSQLFEKYRRRLRRLVAVRLDPRVASRVSPSDIVQETLIDASRRLHDFLVERPLPFFPWLRRLTEDRLVEAYRKHVQAQRRSVDREAKPLPSMTDASSTRLAEHFIDSGSRPSGRLLRAERADLLHQMLLQLRAYDREVLIMRYLEDLEFAEIAATLGITENAVKIRHFRAIQRIGQIMNQARDE